MNLRHSVDLPTQANRQRTHTLSYYPPVNVEAQVDYRNSSGGTTQTNSAVRHFQPDPHLISFGEFLSIQPQTPFVSILSWVETMSAEFRASGKQPSQQS